MNCPLCIDQVLVAHVRNGIEVDVCAHCQGVWLDRGELDKMVRHTDRPDVADSDTKPSKPKKSDKSDKDKSDKKSKKSKKKRKGGIGDLLGDILEDIVDL